MTSVDIMDVACDAARLAQQSSELVAKIAQLASLKSDVDELLTEAEVKERYGMGRAALDARNTPKRRYGRAFRWLVSDILAAVEIAPARPARRPNALENEDPLDAMVRHGELRPTKTRGVSK